MTTLTKADRVWEYDSVSLNEALAGDDSCRHLARMVHLYFSRTPHLTNNDMLSEIPKLVEKVFGVYENGAHLNHGWLFRINHTPKAPPSVREVLQKNFEGSFDDKIWSKDIQASFRVFQLLEANEIGNLFEVVFLRENMNCCVYYMPLELLPNSLALDSHPMKRSLLSMTSNQQFQRPGELSLSLRELLVFRFANWFVYAPNPAPSKFIPPQIATRRFIDHSDCPIYELLRGNPVLEIWKSYVESRFSPNEPDAIDPLFLSAVCYLWLSRYSASSSSLSISHYPNAGTTYTSRLATSGMLNLKPGTELVCAVIMLVVYISMDPCLLVDYERAKGQRGNQRIAWGTSVYTRELRKHLFQFIVVGIPEATRHPTLESCGFMTMASLWLTTLQPWKAPLRWNNAGPAAIVQTPSFETGWLWYVVNNYLLYAHGLVVILKQLAETSRLLREEKDFVLNAFRPIHGAFCDSVICILRACEIIIEDFELNVAAPRVLTKELLSSFSWISSSPEIATISNTIDCMEENRQIIYKILKQQMEELDWDPKRRFIPALLDSKYIIQQVLDGISFVSDPTGSPMSWFSGRPTTKSKDDAVISRLRAIFNVPSERTRKESDSSDVSAMYRQIQRPLASPAAAPFVGTPSWLDLQCVYNRITTLGHIQLEHGRRSCYNDSVSYVGDPLINPPPVRSFENATLVSFFHFLSLQLNSVFNLGPVKYDLQDGRYFPNFRVNLRFLADLRNLLFGVVVCTLMNSIFFRFRIYAYSLVTCIMLISRLTIEDNQIFAPLAFATLLLAVILF